MRDKVEKLLIEKEKDKAELLLAYDNEKYATEITERMYYEAFTALDIEIVLLKFLLKG